MYLIASLFIACEVICAHLLIRKPFAAKELRYRIEQVIKLFYFHSNKEIIKLADGYFYDLTTGKLMREQKVVHLTPKEQKVWDYLLANIGTFIPTKQLWEDVWECKMVTEADIRMCIKKIRDKTSANLISNQKGLGYRIDKKR